MQSDKPIRLSGHACQQLQVRGATEDDIVEAIRSSTWTAAQRGRMECRMDFAFNSVWNGRQYATRQVHPIFVEEAAEIVVVTVYVYYF